AGRAGWRAAAASTMAPAVPAAQEEREGTEEPAALTIDRGPVWPVEPAAPGARAAAGARAAVAVRAAVAARARPAAQAEPVAPGTIHASGQLAMAAGQQRTLARHARRRLKSRQRTMRA